MKARYHARTGWTVALALPALLVVFAGSFAAETTRPTEWAAPVTVEGLPNLFRVTSALYRSAQPSLPGFRNLRQLAIQTVINLRGGEDDGRAALALGFRLESVPLSAARVRHESNVKILRLLGQSDRGPILVHCQHGADRTGMICALYRIVYQGWDRTKAIEEMRKGGYGFHSIYWNLVRYVEGVDVEALRKEVLAPAADVVGLVAVDDDLRLAVLAGDPLGQ
jgi:protein tyrosine/serine phosphatase